VMFVLLSAASILDYLAKPNVTMLALLAAFWFAGVYFQGFMMRYFDDYKYEASLGKRISELAAPDETIHTLMIGESQITYYLRWPILRSTNIESFLANAAENPQDSYHVVIKAHDIETVEQLGRLTIIDEAKKPRYNQEPGNKLVFGELVLE
jgi:hypothetical protein